MTDTALIDLSLTGNLLLIVMFSGYESFVSKTGQHLGRFLSKKWTVWLERGGGAVLVAAAASLLWIKRGPAHV